MNRTLQLKDENDTIALAEEIAPAIRKGDVLALYGDLGSGKTFFTKQLCHFLEVTENVSSPSFVILNEYYGKFPIFHFDLYRLENEEELLEIGIFDVLEEGITIIEWPELARNLLPYDTYHFYFTIEGNFRNVKILKNQKGR
jgi:tRNA threonylcarbamoyl adenosine modification protein YjeE